jgi:hypothetical protein
MIKLDMDEVIIAYFGFVLPIFLLRDIREAYLIAFYIFLWNLTVYLWSTFFSE